MKTRPVIMAAALVVCFGTAAQALDRDAKIIGQAGIDFVSYDEMNSVRVTIWDETALSFEREWAVVAGAGAGKFMGTDGNGNENLWFAALGAKWYPLSTLSLRLLGTCEWVGSGNGYRVVGGTAGLEKRFITEQAALSPFITLDASIQNAKVNPWGDEEDTFQSLLFRAGVGCDMIVSEDVTVVFNVFFTDSQGDSDNAQRDYADGWGGTVALKYFWF